MEGHSSGEGGHGELLRLGRDDLGQLEGRVAESDARKAIFVQNVSGLRCEGGANNATASELKMGPPPITARPLLPSLSLHSRARSALIMALIPYL